MTEDNTITTGTPIPANYRSCMNDSNKLCQCTGTACMGSMDNTITSNEAGVRNSLNSCWLDSGNSLLSTTQNMTEDKTTITDNEVIARFMGAEYVRKPDLFNTDRYNVTYVYQGHPGNWRVENTVKCHFTPPELMYHTEFDWLMPVWYKFKDLNIEDRRKNIVFERFYERIKNAILHRGCSEACKLLAEGIRWYNSTTQNKEQS